jgi:hypothetical protein
MVQMTATESLDDLKLAAIKEKDALLGVLVSFDIAGEVADDVVQASFGTAFGRADGPQGPGTGRALYSPEPVSPEVAHTRAIDDATRGMKNVKKTHPQGRDGVWDVTMVPYENGVAQPKVGFRSEIQVDQYGVRVFCSGPDAAQYEYAIQSGVQHHLRVQSGSDITQSLVTDLIRGRMMGARWRKRGGIYFVPADEHGHNLALLDQLVQAVQGGVVLDQAGQVALDRQGRPKRAGGLKNGARVDLAGSYNHALFRANAAELLHESLMDDLDQLAAELSEFAQDTKTGKKVKASTIEQRLEAFEFLQGRAQVYGDILEAHFLDVGARVERLQKEALALLGVG